MNVRFFSHYSERGRNIPIVLFCVGKKLHANLLKGKVMCIFAFSKIKTQQKYDNSRTTERDTGARAGAEGVSLTSTQKSSNWKKKN
jgi:hypothetical protein